MAIEIGNSKPTPVDFTVGGKALYARKMPLRLGLKMQGEMSDDKVEMDAEVVAEIILQCVVFKDGKPAFESAEEVLGWDAGVMLGLFAEVSSISFTVEDAEKN